uniref:Uncharacterized protein n=1 Tax=uncultured marine virus TaxID=186617 RepID=A0A0F7LBY5_9VIRU|nr:hypothetical protein [uncultured marine virus]
MPTEIGNKLVAVGLSKLKSSTNLMKDFLKKPFILSTTFFKNPLSVGSSIASFTFIASLRLSAILMVRRRGNLAVFHLFLCCFRESAALGHKNRLFTLNWCDGSNRLPLDNGAFSLSANRLLKYES